MKKFTQSLEPLPGPYPRALRYSLLGFLLVAAPAGAVELKSEKEISSYSLGAAIGRQFQADAGQLAIEAFLDGIRDSLKKTPYKLSPEEMSMAIQDFSQKRDQRVKESVTRNLREGEKFLRENARREGVKSLDNGLQYEVKTEGQGAKPAPGASVVVHYHGTLIDGQVFDSSRERNSPLTISLNNVIQGWKEALPLMKTGARWMLYVPPKLAYGEGGSPPTIGPNSTLIFDVELLEIKP